MTQFDLSILQLVKKFLLYKDIVLGTRDEGGKKYFYKDAIHLTRFRTMVQYSLVKTGQNVK